MADTCQAADSNWVEVIEAEFYRVLGPRNVHPRIDGPYPYTSVFCHQETGAEEGKIVQEGTQYPYTERHYLTKRLVEKACS